jgi:hypothetical protein
MMVGSDREWIDSKFEAIRKEIVKVQIDIATLKVKASMWGAVGGAIPIAIGLGIWLLEKL